jgi:hypothetical protein
MQAIRLSGLGRWAWDAAEPRLVAAGMKVIKVQGRGRKPARFYVASTIQPAMERLAERGVIAS